MSPPLSAATALSPAATFDAALDTALAAVSANHANYASHAMHFAGVPITETGSFPPADTHECWVYVTLNAEVALAAHANVPLHGLVRAGRARVSVDGQWPCWALRRKYPNERLNKLAGSDLIHLLASCAANNGKRLLLLGSTPEANGLAVHRLRQRWRGLAVAGYAPPRFGADSSSASVAAVDVQVLAAIDAWKPDYVVLGFDNAKQHAMAARLAPRLDGRVRGLCCFGGAIDMASGRVRRAPAWVQHAGLEGPWRVLQQPSRLLRFLRVLRLLPLLAQGRY